MLPGMIYGPRSEKSSADAVSAAMRVDIEEDDRRGQLGDSPAQALGCLGGAARAKALTKEQRSEIAKKAAEGRWGAGKQK